MKPVYGWIRKTRRVRQMKIVGISACDSCGAEGIPVKEYERRWPDTEVDKSKLCELCACTLTGTAMDYPEQYPEINTMKTICFVGNEILKTLRRK